MLGAAAAKSSHALSWGTLLYLQETSPVGCCNMGDMLQCGFQFGAITNWKLAELLWIK